MDAGLNKERIDFVIKEFEDCTFEQLQLFQAWIGEYCQARVRMAGLESGLLEEAKVDSQQVK